MSSRAPRSNPAGPSETGKSTVGRRRDWALDGREVPCLYASDHISLLDAFGRLVSRAFQCAMVFNDEAPNWQAWADPWFTNRTYADEAWSSWATAPGTHRELIITQNLFPSTVDGTNWLEEGARGAFASHARALARTLIRAGLGWSVIRLAHEANAGAYPDSIPFTVTGDRQWVAFWRQTVLAMRSVRGGHFKFDWTVNAGYRDVPLSSFYPGDDVVDYIGVDAYDAGSGLPPGRARWSALETEPDGIAAVAAFARGHGKPMTIPEWGIGPGAQPGKGQGGDDPAYVDGIASVVRSQHVAYQSYFDGGLSGIQLSNSPMSTAAYRAAFGRHGTAVGPQYAGILSPLGPVLHALALTGGPADGATVLLPTVTFHFALPSGYTATCSLDQRAFTPCTSSTSDVLSQLSPGFHSWVVEATTRSEQMAVAGRTFVVR